MHDANTEYFSSNTEYHSPSNPQNDQNNKKEYCDLIHTHDNQSTNEYLQNSRFNTNDIDMHKQVDISSLTELTFKGVVIGGTYQHCFDKSNPVVAPPCGTDKRVIGISYSNKENLNSDLNSNFDSNLNLKLYLPKDKNTKIISLGKDWRWINTSPDGYLISKGPFSTRKLVCYYIPRHPIEWALEGEREREGYSYGLRLTRSIDSSSSDFYSGHSGSMSNFSKFPVVSTFQLEKEKEKGSDREMIREKEYKHEKENENERNNKNRKNREYRMDISEVQMREFKSEDNADDEQFIHVETDGERDGQDDMYTQSMDQLDDFESVLSLPIHGNKFRESGNHQLSMAQNVRESDCTDNALDDDDVLVSSILKTSNADLNCPHIISFVLEYLLGTNTFLFFFFSFSLFFFFFSVFLFSVFLIFWTFLLCVTFSFLIVSYSIPLHFIKFIHFLFFLCVISSYRIFSHICLHLNGLTLCNIFFIPTLNYFI